ncbi:Pre-mRNA-splicing factor CWC25 [Colletotrichum fructicola Nara gc5]|uniref:Pre-mRNA-splicing factor CWC25 n=1 Tax=Colletotrichum fructicola (strain Nara gc5) TaxID=1213859 RepID=A0A7J6IYT8_COLFN|nr:Pre-mRNA-splicing factor CWC25 [Colletotrichum fructicola Nara gc5]
MGGDLNLKKSFHPSLLKNQAKVWEEEKKALEERKKTQQRINELKEERAREELQKKLEAAGHTKKVDRVEFLYSGPTDGQTGTTEERESYLLGKRRIDNLLKGTEHKNLEKQAGQESFMALQTANTARDTAAKVREDPLLAIKRQEQAAGGITGVATMIQKTTGAISDGALNLDPDPEAPGGAKAILTTKIDVRDDTDVATLRIETEAATDEGDPRGRDRLAAVTQARKTTTRGETEESVVTIVREGANPLSQTKTVPGDRKGEASESRDPRPYDSRRFDRNRDTRGDGRANGKADDSAADEERARKLAAMQAAASDLDTDRDRRLAALEAQEKAAREADNQAREKSSKYGDRQFVNGLHRKAGNLGLAERLGRGRQGLQRDDD